MENDIILNKIQSIEKCIRRINDVYQNNIENLHDITKQDSIILNIQRSCEMAIDIAMHIISIKKLSIPQNSREAFEILCEENIISKGLMNKMKSMVGFRNIAIHDYQKINIDIIKSIIEQSLTDLMEFNKTILNLK
jgi:uncharacterized protein YutE (UPF0331/DUF86 family)